jgi:hypothetical protein
MLDFSFCGYVAGCAQLRTRGQTARRIIILHLYYIYGMDFPLLFIDFIGTSINSIQLRIKSPLHYS